MEPGLSLYRGLTRALGAVLPALWRSSPGDPSADSDPWRGGFRGANDETARAAGSLWIHAASMGEVASARGWVEALLARGYRAPFLFTTRTRTGLERARATWGDRVAARIAPHDFPQTVRAVLEDACPWRLDIIETELWPNLIAEARDRGTPVVIAGATVSERTAARLLR
ncbi:MAG TPA: glycosyltransferase N-terminal domain-containing protein, partial [Candidatus Eisenbacteria bacterium]|nr:glycosyltransferase N-terminal domain-containing protein [Candidatus Eisenbacteria bacterium]